MVELPPRNNQPDNAAPTGERPRYRPPIGMPLEKQRRAGSFVLAVLLHVLVIFLLIVPFSSPELLSEMLGAGGPGPAGGGGGGSGGTGGVNERVEFVQVAPPPPPPPPPVVRPPEIKPIVPPPPPPPPVEEPKPPQPPVADQTAAKDAAQATAPIPGTGGGTGNDGTAGTGPGTGGGKGSGVGTGTGSSTGPGTGGGTGTVYPPSPTELFLPPMPAPNRVRGTELVIVFEVDSTGKVLDFEFSPTKDSGYNRKLREVIARLKFRPAVDGTGTPVRAKAVVTYTL